uniref:Follicular dendritic cell secreted peptide isoform X3 n=1 Tax=Phascolarctos cinereus TaxID=38626 RepID=A0A6P5KF67_PHACI|nr:follicular dendritic cell secreted peptide isoform X3 [Phascolarctos cinereus]
MKALIIIAVIAMTLGSLASQDQEREKRSVMLKFNLDFMFSKSCLLEEGILRPKRKPLLTHIFDSRHLTMFSVIPLL